MEPTRDKAKSKQKVQDMHNRIVEEYQQQKFTFREFEWLTMMLGKSCGDSLDHYHNDDYYDLFYPIPIDESPKPMVTLKGLRTVVGLLLM